MRSCHACVSSCKSSWCVQGLGDVLVCVCACDVMMTTISFCPKEVKIDAVTARGSGWLVDFPSPPSPNNPHLDLDLDLSSPSHLQLTLSSSPLIYSEID